MNRTLAQCWLISGLILLSSGFASAADYKKWDMVVVIADSHLKVNGSQIVDKVWPGLVLMVDAVNGEWLWLDHNGKKGWLQKSQVIPVDRQAIARLTAMIKATPRDARLYDGRASVWLNLRELQKGVDDLGEAIRLEPTNISRYSDRVKLLMVEGPVEMADVAIADCDALIRLQPKVSTNYFWRAVLWAHKQEHDKAIEDYNQVLRMNPNDSDAYSNRGTEWLNKNEYDKAVADFGEAIRLNPQDSTGYHNRATTWSVMGEFDKAIADFDNAITSPLLSGTRRDRERTSGPRPETFRMDSRPRRKGGFSCHDRHSGTATLEGRDCDS